MTRLHTPFTATLLACIAVGMRPAQAAPPTVTPSPGYDARLQEQRKALSAASTPVIKSRRVKRVRTH